MKVATEYRLMFVFLCKSVILYSLEILEGRFLYTFGGVIRGLLN